MQFIYDREVLCEAEDPGSWSFLLCEPTKDPVGPPN
jgi:hypothetical protein